MSAPKLVERLRNKPLEVRERIVVVTVVVVGIALVAIMFATFKPVNTSDVSGIIGTIQSSYSKSLKTGSPATAP